MGFNPLQYNRGVGDILHPSCRVNGKATDKDDTQHVVPIWIALSYCILPTLHSFKSTD